MEKEMLAIAKLKSGEGKFEKFMGFMPVSYTHLRAHETLRYLV